MKKLLAMLAISTALVGCQSTSVEQTAETVLSGNNASSTINEALFHQWFAAEFDNYEQHWQDNIDKKEKPALQVHEHIHHIFAPVPTPALEGTTYFVKQYMDGDASKVYRQRLYQFIRNEEKGALQLNIYRFNDEAKYADAHLKPELYQQMTREELTTYKGCEVYWRFTGEYFTGEMEHNACGIMSKRSGKMIYFNDTLRLTDNEIWIADSAHDAQGNYVFGNKAGIPHINRKVTYFTGWGGNRLGGDSASSDAPWAFTKNIMIHNEGQIIPLTDDKTGEASGYSVQLAKLTYQNTQNPILKLGLIENSSNKTVTYIWSDRENIKTGINLRWMQVGLTKKAERPHFGF